jgi:dipeptidyl-peptidase-4
MRLTIEQLTGDQPITGREIEGVVWHPDGRRLTYLEPSSDAPDAPQDLWVCELETGERSCLLQGVTALRPVENGAEPRRFTLGGYQWLPSGEGLLLAEEGEVWTYALPSREARRLAAGTDPDVPPLLSPNGEKMAYVRGGNLWVAEPATGRERALTSDGSAALLNGKLDWVYWEELGHRNGWRAFEWSPDGEKLAFLRLDQSPVPEYPLVGWMETHPRVTLQRYPKAGDPNSTPALFIVRVTDGEVLARSVEEDDRVYYAPGLAWTADSRAVLFSRVNRDQRALELRTLPVGGEARTLVVEADPHWLNHVGPAHPVPGSDGFLWVSEAEGRARLYLHAADGERLRALTPTDWQVEEVLGVDERAAYVLGTGSDPRERHYYRVLLSGERVERQTPIGSVHRVNRDARSGWALVRSTSPVEPPRTHLYDPQGQARAAVREPEPGWEEYDWAQGRFVELAAEDGTPLCGRLLLPKAFELDRRYPVVVHVYGGPHAQTVRHDWPGGDALDQLLVQEGILVWKLDNRGSWGRGHAFETPLDRRLGTIELADQLGGVQWLREQPFVDPQRIGITGWSYGGFVTLYAMLKAPEVWRCGAAGAPVTDWKLYDSTYTERYMGTPEENPEGYRAASVLEAAEHLRAPLLLMHGTDDDNVHLQHTLQLVEAFSRHGKPYELMVQPGQKHGFRGASPRAYLHRRMVEFFTQHLVG